MGYIILTVVYVFLLFFLQPPKDVSGDAIYKGELDDCDLRPIRYFLYLLFWICTTFPATFYEASYPFLLVGVQLIYAAAIEGRILYRSKRLRTAGSGVQPHRASDAGAGAHILTPAELEERERQRFAEIVGSGRLDDVIDLAMQNCPLGTGGKTFPIPRWLTRDEYRAVQSAFKEKGWFVSYSLFAKLTNNPSLYISRNCSREAVGREAAERMTPRSD